MGNTLSIDRQAQVIAHLVDGCGIRATERLTDVYRNTIMRLSLAVGEGCLRLHDRLFRNLHCSVVQLDEQHSWVHTRQVHLKTTDPVDEWGEQWTFLALDVTSRAAVTWLIGKRTAENATTFALDLRRRVEGSPLLYSDGLKGYIDAVEKAFGTECRYGQLVKTYEGDDVEGARNGRYKGAHPVSIQGNVDLSKISTSLIERQNLTTRQESRRQARKTLGHSKTLRHHTAALALFYAHYNLVRIHSTLRVTPAMAVGVEKRVWSIADLVEAALSEPMPQVPPPVEPSKPPQDPFQMFLPGTQPGLRVIHGGKR